MKERPILFSAPMVQALLAGTKTQTRRVAKHPAIATLSYIVDCGDGWFGDEEGDVQVSCPYGQVGDQLWVRETHAIVPRTAYAQSEGVHQVIRPNDNHDAAVFKAGWELCNPSKWRPSIHMPRWASRIQLEITNIRVERLQDISEADALAEGITYDKLPNNPQDNERAKTWYMGLWEIINGTGSWNANPWVWVVEFKVIKP